MLPAASQLRKTAGGFGWTTAAMAADCPHCVYRALRHNNPPMRIAAFLAAFLLLGVSATPAAEVDDTLAVMTFNLRYASLTPPNSWPQRRPVVAQVIKRHAPDLIGTQEGLYAQLRNMAADLPEYDWIGLGRAGGSRDEFMAVFYRKDRFEPQEFDHFWLSDTPEVVGSITWGHKVRRMCTWVRFKDNRTGQVFYFVNTHLDHEVQPAREKGAELIRGRILSFKPEYPVIGDFNAAAGNNKAYDILTADGAFVDAWNAATKRIGPAIGTFHNYKPAIPDGDRIDWILTRGPFKVESAQIITDSNDGQFPSDHFPVMAKLQINR